MNYYILLGVAQDADADTIRSAFRGLARRYHPDAGVGSSAERFREILTAYETLNDPDRRGRYDRSLKGHHSSVTQFVEPLFARVAPEPMLSRPRGVVPMNSLREARWLRRHNDVVDELLQLWAEVYVGPLRCR
jgi:curved DNA-binding protein CbpA